MGGRHDEERRPRQVLPAMERILNRKHTERTRRATSAAARTRSAARVSGGGRATRDPRGRRPAPAQGLGRDAAGRRRGGEARSGRRHRLRAAPVGGLSLLADVGGSAPVSSALVGRLAASAVLVVVVEVARRPRQRCRPRRHPRPSTSSSGLGGRRAGHRGPRVASSPRRSSAPRRSAMAESRRGGTEPDGSTRAGPSGSRRRTSSGPQVSRTNRTIAYQMKKIRI